MPDSMPPGRMVEVKDVKVLSHSRQIRGQISAAAAERRTCEIIIGPGTSLTGAMQAIVRRSGIVITRNPLLGHGDP